MPASSAEKREESTMIGIRATSGSVARRLRKVVIASSASSRSASMFTSRRFAPPRTCSTATVDRLAKSPASISRRNLAEPVTFVRSPTITKPVSGPIDERLETGEARPRRGLGHAPRAQPLDCARDLSSCARASSRSSRRRG